MDNRTAWLVNVLRVLIARYPARANDPDWLAAEASETHGADPQEARAAYQQHVEALTGGHNGD